MISTLDPFLREKPEDVKRLSDLQEDVFATFKELVRERRKGKLKGKEDELFTGAFWTGKRALELGLIDGLGELTDVMRQRYGERVKFHPIEQRQGWFKQKLGILAPLSKANLSPVGITDLVAEVLISAEEQSHRNRYGL